SPPRDCVVHEGIIHPLSHFVTQRMNVFNRHVENAGVAIRCHADGQLIGRLSESSVESKDAACALREKCVVRQEKRKCVCGNSPDVLPQPQLEIVDRNLSDSGAWTRNGVTEKSRDGNCLKRHDNWSPQGYVIARRSCRNFVPEICSLKGVYVLRV